MKSICICGSFKFYKDIMNLANKLRGNGILLYHPIPTKLLRDHKNPSKLIKGYEKISKQMKLKEAYRMTYEHFNRVHKADITYVFAKGGYVGKGVSMEIGYAFTNGKIIYSSEEIDDLPVASLVDQIVPINRILNKLS